MKESKTAYLDYDRLEATPEFIAQNKLQLKSQEELTEKFNSVIEDSGMFDFRPEVLMNFLTFDNVKKFLNDDYVKEVEAGTKTWEQVSTIEEAAQDFLDYMNFAWGKAEDQRGISASRSIQKLGMWLWIMSREDLTSVIGQDDLYNPYGAPALVEVCNQLSINVPDSLIEFAKHKCED